MHSVMVGASETRRSLLYAYSMGSFSSLALSIDSYFRELKPAMLSDDTLVTLSAVVDTVLHGLVWLSLPSFEVFGGA